MAPESIGLGPGRIQLGIGPRAGGAFNPASIFTTEQGVIYDLTNPATAFQERTGASATTPSGVDGPIGSLKDFSPNNNWCIAPSDAARPLWRAAGYAEGDGIDDFLTALFTIAQPITRIACWRPITNTGGQAFGGAAANNGVLFGSGGNNHSIASGAVLLIASIAAGTDVVTTERHSGVTSRGALNNGAYLSGDAGTGVPGGIRIGASNGGGSVMNMRLYRVIEIARDLTDPEIAACRTWCGAAAGLVL